jgi:hypothetical protein
MNGIAFICTDGGCGVGFIGFYILAGATYLLIAFLIARLTFLLICKYVFSKYTNKSLIPKWLLISVIVFCIFTFTVFVINDV